MFATRMRVHFIVYTNSPACNNRMAQPRKQRKKKVLP